MVGFRPLGGFAVGSTPDGIALRSVPIVRLVNQQRSVSMRDGDASEFVYSVEPRRVGAGQTIWQWEIRRPGESAPLLTSVSLQSRAAAERDAKAAIRKRCGATPPVRPRTDARPAARCSPPTKA